MAAGRQPQPQLVKGYALDVDAEFAELVEVAVAALPQLWKSMPSLKLAWVA